MAQINTGKTPPEIVSHEKVTRHYGIPAIDLAREVTERINAGEFEEPVGVAIAPDTAFSGERRAYVVDTWNQRIQVFDASGTFLFKFGSLGSGDGQFDSPWGVAVDASGKIYVTDVFNRRIQVFDASGDFPVPDSS